MPRSHIHRHRTVCPTGACRGFQRPYRTLPILFLWHEWSHILRHPSENARRPAGCQPGAMKRCTLWLNSGARPGSSRRRAWCRAVYWTICPLTSMPPALYIENWQNKSWGAHPGTVRSPHGTHTVPMGPVRTWYDKVMLIFFFIVNISDFSDFRIKFRVWRWHFEGPFRRWRLTLTLSRVIC